MFSFFLGGDKFPSGRVGSVNVERKFSWMNSSAATMSHRRVYSYSIRRSQSTRGWACLSARDMVYFSSNDLLRIRGSRYIPKSAWPTSSLEYPSPLQLRSNFLTHKFSMNSIPPSLVLEYFWCCVVHFNSADSFHMSMIIQIQVIFAINHKLFSSATHRSCCSTHTSTTCLCIPCIGWILLLIPVVAFLAQINGSTHVETILDPRGKCLRH